MYHNHNDRLETLFSWVKRRFLSQIDNDNPINSIDIKCEHGACFRSTINEYQLTNYHAEKLIRMRKYMVSRIGELTKKARYLERVLVTLIYQDSSTETILIVRHDDVKYIHSKTGQECIKVMVRATPLSDQKLPAYLKHFWICPFIFKVLANPYLSSVIVDGLISKEKYDNLLSRYSKDSEVIDTIDRGIKDLNTLAVYWAAETDEGVELLRSINGALSNYQVKDDGSIYIPNDAKLNMLGEVRGATPILIERNSKENFTFEDKVNEELIKTLSESVSEGE